MGTVSQASRNMKAFVIVALVAAVSGEADPYTIGQVLAGQTNGGVLTSTTYHGGVKVAGFPYTKVAAVPAVSYAAAYPYAHAGVYYGKREAEAEPWTVGQIAAGAHVAEAIKDGRAHNVGVITNAAIAPVAATHVVSAYAGYPYTYGYYGKREAEADPAVVYTSGLVGYPYTVGAHAVTYAGAPHAVAYTPFGVTHSSNVGICTNVDGAVVPCRRKREADADPALVYAGAVPYTYGVLPYAGVHGTNPVHAVAHTAAGLTHSSNVGICTNYVGAVVPC